MRFINRSRAGYLATLAAGVAIGFTAVGTAVALPHHTSAPAPAAATKIKHYTVAASAFAPDGLHNTANDYFNQWDAATLSNTDGGRCFNAGAVLPNGATIRSVTFFFTNGSSDGFYGELNRQNLGKHTARILVFVSTKPSATATYTVKTKKVTKHNVVDTSKYAYGFGVCPIGDATFTGVMVNYTS
jgi:hypothetical protein